MQKDKGKRVIMVQKCLFYGALNRSFQSFLFAIIIVAAHFSDADAWKNSLSEKNISQLQTIVNRSSDGDTVFIPEGIYLIDSTVYINHGLTVMGAGLEKTVLVFNPEKSVDTWAFKVKCRQGELRFSGFTIKGCAPHRSSGILIKGNCKNFRIDHCKFEQCTKRAIEIHGDCWGVIDHNKFIDNWYTSIVVFGSGEKSWNKPLSLGTENAVYVEDNIFKQKNIGNKTMAHHIASNNGSRYVFRYNDIDDGDIASHAIDAHGNKYGWKRGSRSYEIYRNKINAIHRWAGINIRGGDGVIFENEISGDYISPVHMMHEGRNGDGNCSYPCEDQIRILYIWKNTYNGNKIRLRIRHPGLIKYNRDIILDSMPGYKPFRYPHPLVK